MQLQTKALYNLLRINYLEDDNLEYEPWQVEDFRLVTSEEIFERLKQLSLPLDSSQFLSISEKVDTPEEMTEILLKNHREVDDHDQIYLLIFELFRRFSPYKVSLSILCDELDYRISQYDQGELSSDESIQDVLAHLQKVLYENVDSGVKPLDVMCTLGGYCAHDLESFLYDYITEQIEGCYHSYARELLEDFHLYISNVKRLDFLKIRLCQDVGEANRMLEMLIKGLKEAPQVGLQLEILRFMVQVSYHPLFMELLLYTFPKLQLEEDFQEIMEITSDYYRRLDLEEIEKSIQKIMQRRTRQNLTDELNPEDPDMREFICLFSNKNSL